MSIKLSKQQCEPCMHNTSKISEQKIPLLLAEISDWKLVIKDDVMMIERVFTFKNYNKSWAFANKVSELAESQSHHPAILLEWGRVTVTWWTHTISGLHKNDFICASKTDDIYIPL